MASTSAEENRKAILAKKVEQAKQIMNEFNNRAEINKLRGDPAKYRQAVAELSNSIKKSGKPLEDIKGTTEIQKLAAETSKKIRSLAIQQRQASKSSKTPSSPSRIRGRSKTPTTRSSLSSKARKEKKKIEKAKEVEKKAKKKAEKKATKEAKKKAKEEAKRKAEAEKKAKAKQLAEAARIARIKQKAKEEAEKKRLEDEAEKKRLEDEAEKKRLEEEAEKKRLEEEAEQQRKAKQKKDCSKAKQDLRNALQKEGEKLDGAQDIKDIEKVKNVGKELKKFDTAFKGVDNYCKSIVSVADLQSKLETLEKKQQNKLKELEELQRKKMKEAEEKEKMETEIEDEIETLTGILNNTIQSGPEFLPKEMKDGRFDRKKLDEYTKRYQDSKGFEEKIDELQQLYKKKKQEIQELKKIKERAIDELPEGEVGSYKERDFVDKINNMNIESDMDMNAVENKAFAILEEARKLFRIEKLKKVAKKANNLSNAVKTFEDVLKDKSKADRDALKKLKKDTNSYIYKIIDNAETMLASPDRKNFITFARDTINELLLLETFQESVKRRNKSKYFEGKSLKLRDNTVWKNYRKELYEILKEIILDQNTLLSYFGYAYEFPEYMEQTVNPMNLPPPPTFNTDKEYAFLKIQSIGVDYVLYDNKIIEMDDDEEEFQLIDIINVQGTRKGYGSKIIRSMFNSYTDGNYKLPKFTVLSPYLVNNPGLHKVYHDKWGMKYLSLNEKDKKIINDYFGGDEITKIEEEIVQNTVENTDKRVNTGEYDKDPLDLENQTYLIIKTSNFLDNPRFQKSFEDVAINSKEDIDRIQLDAKYYKDIIKNTLLKEADGSEIKDKIVTQSDVQKSLKKTVDFNKSYLYFYPLKPKDETKTDDDVWTEDELKEKTVKQLKSIIKEYKKSGGQKPITQQGNKTEIIKKIVDAEIPKGIEPKLFDLQSIWDDQEDLMVPPPSSLGLAARKAREFMVFE